MSGDVQGGLLRKSLGLHQLLIKVDLTGNSLLTADEISLLGWDWDWSTKELTLQNLFIDGYSIQAENTPSITKMAGDQKSSVSTIIQNVKAEHGRVSYGSGDSTETIVLPSLHSTLWYIDGFVDTKIHSALSSLDKAEQVLALVDAEATALNHFFVEFSQSESSQIQSSLNALANTLSGPTSVDYAFSNERGEFSIEGSASINISQYYLNAITDFKTLLPPYTMSTTTAYNYSQTTLYEHISFEETEVLLNGLSNTPISVNIQYSESNSDTTATVSLGFLTFNLLTANQSDLPVAIWDLWAEFLLTVGDYSDELHQFPEISFQWSGLITTGTNLIIDGDIAIDYLERISEYTAPDILWTATSYGDWVSGWSDPTANGMFPDFLAEDLAFLLGISWE